ncbi:MAG: ABC transporter permease [Alphaproteobacteria bacterium]
MKSKNIIPYLQVAPLAIVLFLFLAAPMALVLVVSVFRNKLFVGLVPAFTFENYFDIFTHMVNYQLYFSTIRFTVIVLAITTVLGFWIAYFLVFHVRSLLIAIGLFLVCTVPFWTSNIIRMISWKPLLGREGLVNTALLNTGVIEEPVLWLLFSDFTVVLSYVHLFTLFMIVPIFNSMARIDKSLVEAAVDAGASRWMVIWNVIVPLCKSGIALGAVFVVTLVMSDFFVVAVMSGGLSGSVSSGVFFDLSILNYPRAAANSIILLVIVVMIAAGILRIVDVRKELTG